MPADVVDTWLRGGQYARIGKALLRPLENTLLPGMTMSIQRGQAEAFILEARDGSRWILKKFHTGRGLDRAYLQAVSALLPRSDRFLAGTGRHVVGSGDLVKELGCHYSKAFAKWLDGTVLMPCISGLDWAGLADEIRAGNLVPRSSHRLLLCRNLAESVQALEGCGCSHRDLAAGNILIDLRTWAIFPIDFDSFFHASLQLPPATTCGTAGYAPPFGWSNDHLDPTATWCVRADRFALAILCVEFLVLERNAPMINEGGLFDQEDLKRRGGKSIDYVRDRLKTTFPKAMPLLEAAIQSNGFDQCPGPDAWIGLDPASRAVAVPAPKLDDIEAVTAGWFQKILARRVPAATIWPAPRLVEMPAVVLTPPQIIAAAVTLPRDPWIP